MDPVLKVKKTYIVAPVDNKVLEWDFSLAERVAGDDPFDLIRHLNPPYTRNSTLCSWRAPSIGEFIGTLTTTASVGSSMANPAEWEDCRYGMLDAMDVLGNSTVLFTDTLINTGDAYAISNAYTPHQMLGVVRLPEDPRCARIARRTKKNSSHREIAHVLLNNDHLVRLETDLGGLMHHDAALALDLSGIETMTSGDSRLFGLSRAFDDDRFIFTITIAQPGGNYRVFGVRTKEDAS